ncbi:CPBP family intramembrane metalloprotease [Agromyces sp. CFH 90414]|uniref:CPBP family intramembrane metalloprotease n=1 Tax=Agromyces agglutinans TaxID=2662258 RepID=A0A6I2F829_9MICO|nr:CPBP family intramembrane glutamic endopeptidase [Agromyces agglutinans]MRG60424.1 CPBP family intramembrane metalloprotease [Agromyces agglutinans]
MGGHGANAGLRDAAIGILLALAGILVWAQVVRTVVLPPVAQAIGAYLVVWLPLAIATLVAWRRAGMPRAGTLPADTLPAETRSDASADSRPALVPLAFRPIDLLWGVGVALVLRGVAAAIEIAVLGRMSGSGVQLEVDPATAWLALVVAPILVGPFVEEWFFRGLVVPAVRDSAVASGAGSRTAAAIGVVVSAVLFGLLHTVEAPTPATALVTGASAFAFGLAAGALAVLTGRLGGAIIAHAVYNGLLVALLVG